MSVQVQPARTQVEGPRSQPVSLGRETIVTVRRERKDQWPDKHLSGPSDSLSRLLGKRVTDKTVTPTELPRWRCGPIFRPVRGVLSLKETQKSGSHIASRKGQKRRETLEYEFFCIFWVLFHVSSPSKAE